MSEAIFRKKSLDKVKSPESLDDYIRVANPGVWLLLVSVIVLMIGVCVWGVFGHIDSTVPATVRVEDGKAVCYIAEENITSLQEGLRVTFADTEAKITDIGDMTELGYCCALSAEAGLSDGYYDGKVITQQYQPLSFILN